MNKLAILVAGHGGGDNGAVGQGVYEAGQAIDITNRAMDLCRADGRFSVYTVPHELGLVGGINHINAKWKAVDDGVATEIHKNSGGGTGNEVWYYSGDSDSANLAQKLLNGLTSATGLKSRGIKGDATNRHGRLGFIRDTNTWAVLAECGFIDVDWLDTQKYAQGIYEGYLQIFGLGPKAPTVPPVPEWKRTRQAIPAVELYALDDTTPLRNLANPSEVIKNHSKGTSFKIVGECFVGGHRYLMTEYAWTKETGQGFDEYELGAKEAPIPPEPTYKITNLDGVQIGTTDDEATAWAMYKEVSGSARIWSKGVDVTGTIVAKYREDETPVEPPTPDPKDNEQDARLNAIEAFIQLIKDAWKKIFNRNIGE